MLRYCMLYGRMGQLYANLPCARELLLIRHTVLWLWFPFGPTGIRTLLLLIPAFTIYLLRISQWHVGRRQTLTRAESFQKYFLRVDTIRTLAFYIFSAWLYNEVYTWSRTEKSRLNFTELGRAHERLKLNERPLYLRYLFVALAVAQAIVHLWRDYDRIDVTAMQPKKLGDESSTETTVKRGPKPRSVLWNQMTPMFVTAAVLSLFVAVAGSILYFFGPRQMLWDYYYNFSRNFISLAKTSKPTGVAPFAPLVAMFVVEGTLLVLLWEFSNKAFDLYIAQEPFKNNRPITSDSKDPNGTLLNGLKSKKDAVKVCDFILILFRATNDISGDGILGTGLDYRCIFRSPQDHLCRNRPQRSRDLPADHRLLSCRD